MNAFFKAFGRNSDLVLVLGVIGILVVLFAPIPAQLLDVLLLLNFSLALLLLLMTFYVNKPVEFSTYPSLLLIATLFRLSLNIAATRLILANAEAGRVIGAIGSYVVQGNYVIGLIVFLILVVVQYVVVTSGAQRVAEVAARFTLDSMPGQQMSIDADLNMGFIDQAEAQQRRKNLEREANFYGAMDGASKFVKGDAIAGILILLIDIFGGLAVGMLQQGMGWAEAVQTFTLLTIGDGIVTQVPALVISVGTGIIVTRSGSDEHLSKEIFQQVSSFPRALMLVIGALLGIGFLPGIPLVPVLVVAVLMVAGYFVSRRSQSEAATNDQENATSTTTSEDLADALSLDPIEVSVGSGLVGLINSDDTNLSDRIAAFRKQFALERGFVVPKLRIIDDKRLSINAYSISIYGVVVGQSELRPNAALAIHPSGTHGKLKGESTLEPTYGMPAVWIDETQKNSARQDGYTVVDPLTVFVTHLTEALKKNVADLLTRSSTAAMIEQVRKSNPSLIEEIIPAVVSPVEIQKVLQNLLKERVSIRNFEAVLEVLADAGRLTKNADDLTENVRKRLGPAICQELLGAKSELSVLTLDPAVEQKIFSSLQAFDNEKRVVLEPKFAEQVLGKLAASVEQMLKGNASPILLCAPELRRHIRSMTERVLPHLAILSVSEVPSTVNLRSFGVVKT